MRPKSGNLAGGPPKPLQLLIFARSPRLSDGAWWPSKSQEYKTQREKYKTAAHRQRIDTARRHVRIHMGLYPVSGALPQEYI